MSTNSSGVGGRAPYRKAEVVRASLLDATVALLSERPLHDIGVRDIAARAGVQHSLVTRHFGSKDALVAEAVASVASEYAAAVTADDDGAAGYVSALRHLRERPHLALVLAVPADGRSGASVVERFPGFAAHLDRLHAEGAADDLRTRVAAGLAFAMVTAWNLVEPVLLAAADIGPDAAPEARALAEDVVAGFVREATAPTTGGRLTS